MDTAPSTPDADVIYGLYKGDYKVQLVRIALRLDVFSPVAAGATDAETVARACSCTVKGMRALLEYLHSIHLLSKEGNTYALTSTAATFLVPGKPGYAGELLLMETDPQLWEGVLQALRSGQPVHPSVPWEQDAWLESYRAWRPARSHEMWRAAGIEPGRCPGLRVLDVACGCAIKSFVLAQADPTVHITCLDRAEVLEVARALAERLHLLPQVTFLPADLHAVQFGADQYDAALLGQITHHLTPVQNQSVMQRVFHALAPGGLLVIDVPLRAETGPSSEEVSLLNVALGAIRGGAVYTVADYRGWLQQSGFGEVRRLGERWLAAYKA